MRYIRIGTVVLFLIAAVIFGAAKWKGYASRNMSAPVISADSDSIEISVNYTEGDLLKGLKAWDEQDGDLTDQILVGEFSQFISEGVCNISYIVFDSANQPGVFRRRVVFSDYEAPVFTLEKPLVFRAGEGADAMALIGARDLLDGDLSSMVREKQNDISYLVPGSYTVSVEAANSFGAVSETALPVHIVEEGKEILRPQEPILYISAGTQFSPEQYAAGLCTEEGIPVNAAIIQTESNINTEVPGVYEARYFTDTQETWMTVVVR